MAKLEESVIMVEGSVGLKWRRRGAVVKEVLGVLNECWADGLSLLKHLGESFVVRHEEVGKFRNSDE